MERVLVFLCFFIVANAQQSNHSDSLVNGLIAGIVIFGIFGLISICGFVYLLRRFKTLTTSVTESHEEFTDDDEISASSPSSKRTALARKAYRNKDPEASKRAHESAQASKEKHKKGGEFLKSVVYGGLDGIITIFAVVTGTTGGSLTSDVVLILGFSSLFADGLSMGLCDFISSKAEADYVKFEQRREVWEYENNPEDEKNEMIELYMKKGLDEDQAKELVKVLSLNKSNFIDTMMVEELGLLPVDPDDSPAKAGLVTFCSFIIFGLIPMLPYIVSGIKVAVEQTQETDIWGPFIASCVLTGTTMFLLGAVTSYFSTQTWYQAGGFMFFIGALSALASYFISWAVSAIVDAVHPTVPRTCNMTTFNTSDIFVPTS
eukprot:TRINITY_DN3219_c0_g1_i1.p1 TRINITY_DN3219_c0_g1~~TRINITY_DN3219_c0_g1_i1.p1  ORF type:complete len:376 (+),score=89.39 TRINITY_DN3219_c0_g1_i1:81-1208(+)